MNRHGRTYRSIASDLRERIVRGDFRASGRLPTEAELSRHYSVSRITTRHALSLLQEERLVTRRQGSGTFVSPRPSRKIPLMIDYTGSMRNHAPALKRRVTAWKWMPAPKGIAEMLDIEVGEMLLYAERVDDLKGVPVAWDQAYIARSFAGTLTEKHLARVDFVETWTSAAAFRLEACEQLIEACAASPSTCARLRVKPKQPVLKSTETYHTFRNRPAGVFISYYHPAHIWIHSRYRWTHPHEEKETARPIRARLA